MTKATPKKPAAAKAKKALSKTTVKASAAKKTLSMPKQAVASKTSAPVLKPVAVKPAASTAKPTAKIFAATSKPAAKLPGGSYFYAIGKRKTAIASVRMYANGKGVVTVNGRTFENYFPLLTDQDKILSPLRMTSTAKLFDVSVKVMGGGVHSQAEAVRHGIARALLEHDGNLRTTLKHIGFLTRDSRVKERKKYGLKRARRAPQWQKR